MHPLGRAFGWPIVGAFAVASIADARCVTQHPGVCGDDHHMAAFAVAQVSGTASISSVHISLSEGKVEAAPAPPPSPLSGHGVAFVVKPDRPSDG